MRIRWPFWRSACLRLHNALSPPSQIAANSLKLKPVGMTAMRALSRTRTKSACVPKLNPVLLKTWSPTSNLRTSLAKTLHSMLSDGSILLFAALGIEGVEIMAMLEVAMLGNIPYTVLRDGVFAHPTLAESL